MKIIILLVFVIFTLSATASTKNVLNFTHTIKLKKVVTKSALPKNLETLYRPAPQSIVAALK